MEKASGGETVDAAAGPIVVNQRSRNSRPTSRSLCRKQWGEAAQHNPPGATAVYHHQTAVHARGRYCSEWPSGALYQPWQPAAVSRPLTKAVALVPYGRGNAVHRRRWHSQLGARRSGRSNAEPESCDKRLHVTAIVRNTSGINKTQLAKMMDAVVRSAKELR